MSATQVLPFISTLVMLVFTISVLQRFAARRKPHFLFWGIGLAMFGFGSFAEAYFAVAGWSAPIFFGWYLFGAALNAAWIGHGTLLLLNHKRWVHVLTAALVIGSVAATALMVQAMPRLETDLFDPALPISQQYGTKVVEADDEVPAGAEVITTTYRGEEVRVIRGLMPLGTSVRLATPFFNIYGLITLVGGALWSAWLFLRKRVLPNRVIGNVLIAAGALAIASASTLTRLGYGQYLYLGELVAATLMYAGFVTASAPATEMEASPAALPV
jgi:hypothetical protein